MSPTALRPIIETLEPRLYLDSFAISGGGQGLMAQPEASADLFTLQASSPAMMSITAEPAAAAPPVSASPAQEDDSAVDSDAQMDDPVDIDGSSDLDD